MKRQRFSRHVNQSRSTRRP